jgi:hypothetical protein
MDELDILDEAFLPDCFGEYYGTFYEPCKEGDAGLCSYCRECQKSDPAY